MPYAVHLSGSSAPRNVQGTLAIMRQMVNAGKINPAVLNLAHSLAARTREHSAIGECRACYEYVRDNIRYTMDVRGVETISAPWVVLERGSGDCDDQTALLCALFESIGYETQFIVAGYETRAFEHVYCRVLCDNVWIECDPIMRGAFFGWYSADAQSIDFERQS